MAEAIPETLRLRSCTVDLLRGRVYRGDRVERLTATEARLLRHLAARAGEIVDRGVLYEEVWGYARDSRSRTLDVTVGNLRKKIEAEPRMPDHILTEVGIGYRLVFEGPGARPLPRVAADGPLFGRERVEQDVATRLRTHGQVSVVGMPGVGKTALARSVAAQGSAHWSAGCVEVAGDERPEIFLARLGEAFGVEPTPGGPGIERQLARSMERRGALLLLVDDAAPALVEVLDLLRQEVASLDLLVTAPRAIGLLEERVVDLPPLDADAGVALFLERVGARRPDHTPDLEQVSEIVALLEGLPLALEIAASRSAMVGEARTLEHLRKAEPSESLAALERALGWAWEQLSETERSVLAQASVFRGGFSIEAAEAVLEHAGEGRGLVAILESLSAHGLLELERADDGLRPYLREPVRAFAAARLEGDAALRRYVSWYAARAARPGPDASESERDAAFAWLVREHANLEHALRQGVALVPESAARLAIGLQAVGLHQLGTERYREILELGQAAAREVGSSRLLAELLVQRVGLEVDRVGAEAAAPHLVETEALVEALDDPRLLGLLALARAKVSRSRGAATEALELAEEAVQRLTASEDRHAEASARAWLGFRLSETGELTEAYEQLERALSLASTLGSVALEIKVRVSWTAFLYRRGRLDEAVKHQERALELARARGLRRWEGAVLNNLAILRTARGDLGSAREHLELAVAVNEELGAVASTAYARALLGELLGQLGELEEAERLFALSLDALRRGGDRRLLAQGLHWLGRTRLLQGLPDAASVCLREAIELFTLLEQPWDLDHARLDLALALHELGSVEHARFTLGRIAEGAPRDRTSVARSLATAQLGALHALEGSQWAALACIEDAEADLAGVEDPAVTAALAVWRGFLELAELRALDDGQVKAARGLRSAIQQRLAPRVQGIPGELPEPPMPRTYPQVVARLLRWAIARDEAVA